MKRIAVTIFLLILNGPEVFSQEFREPSEGKSMVYFVRYRGAVAVLDFKYFDGERFIGQVNVTGNHYYAYECDPGEHVFWVSAENKEFIKGDLKPNSTYVVEVRPYFRAVMTGAELLQVSPDDKKALKNIDKLMKKEKEATMKKLDADKDDQIDRGMDRYKKIENKVPVMNPDWTF